MRVWREVSQGAEDPDVAELLAIARRLGERLGLESVLGLSLQVRCETWLAHNEEGA